MAEAFICAALRTPIGRYGGALSSVRPDDLAAIPLRELMARNKSVDWNAVDDVVFGCANQAGEDNRNVARMALSACRIAEGNSRQHDQSPVRLGHGRGGHRRAGDQVGRGGTDDRRRGGEHVACALRHAQGRQRFLANQCGVRHDDRLAFRQPGDEAALRHRLDAGDRGELSRRNSASRGQTRMHLPCARRRRPPPRKRMAGWPKKSCR